MSFCDFLFERICGRVDVSLFLYVCQCVCAITSICLLSLRIFSLSFIHGVCKILSLEPSPDFNNNIMTIDLKLSLFYG